MAQSTCDLKNSSPALIILGLALIIIALLLLFKFLDPTTKKIVEALDNPQPDPESTSGYKIIDFTNADPNIHATVVTDPSVPLPTKPLPTKEGCWYMYPSGCDNKKGKRHSWLLDTWGEEHAGTGNSSAACSARQDALIKMCGNQDVKTHFVPTTGWQKCATEHGTCNGTGIVKYCSERDKTKCSNWKNVSGSVKCEDGVFGDPDFGHIKECYIKGKLAAAPAPTSSNTPPSSWISHDGNCKAAVINTYPNMGDALDACICDDSCQALYAGKDNRWSTRKSCCNVKPKPSWCTDDNKCTTGISCNTQQGGTTYIKPGSTPPPKATGSCKVNPDLNLTGGLLEIWTNNCENNGAISAKAETCNHFPQCKWIGGPEKVPVPPPKATGSCKVNPDLNLTGGLLEIWTNNCENNGAISAKAETCNHFPQCKWQA